MPDITPTLPPLSDIGTETDYRDYFALLKPRVMSLVIFTGFAGLWIAPGVEHIHPLILAVSMLCLALGAGAAGAFNMWYDRDIDAVMNRTKSRPLPAGRISADSALGFAVFVSFFAVMIMGLAVNWVAAALLAFANIFYCVIYTILLKRTTPQNIVIGGAAGAFPPVIGWAAVTGDVSTFPIILFMLIFLWTPPHFWALSLFANSDYKRANIPMMTVTAGEKSTKRQMVAYTLVLFPVAILPFILGYTGLIYGISAALLGGFFVFTAVKTLQDESERSAKRMFAYSVFYLFAIFLALIIDVAA